MLPVTDGTCKNTFSCQFYQCFFSLDVFLRLHIYYFYTPPHPFIWISALKYQSQCVQVPFASALSSAPRAFLRCFPDRCSSVTLSSERLVRRVKRSYKRRKGENKLTSIQMLVLVLNRSVLDSALSATVCWIGKARVYFLKGSMLVKQADSSGSFQNSLHVWAKIMPLEITKFIAFQTVS